MVRIINVRNAERKDFVSLAFYAEIMKISYSYLRKIKLGIVFKCIIYVLLAGFSRRGPFPYVWRKGSKIRLPYRRQEQSNVSIIKRLMPVLEINNFKFEKQIL